MASALLSVSFNSQHSSELGGFVFVLSTDEEAVVSVLMSSAQVLLVDKRLNQDSKLGLQEPYLGLSVTVTLNCLINLRDVKKLYKGLYI